MLGLTLAQMRRSLGRLAAAGIAIALGTAFVTATLLAGDVMTRTTTDAVTTGLADAALVVQPGPGGGTVDARTLTVLGEVPGVAAVHGYAESYVELSGTRGRSWLPVTATAADARLETSTLTDGALPANAGQIALPDAVAERLGVAIGGTVTATHYPVDAADGEALVEELEVVGVLETPAAFLSTGGVGVVTADRLDRWRAADGEEASPWWRALVAVDDGADVVAVGATLDEATEGLLIQTRGEYAASATAALTGSSTVLVAIVLAFAAVALLVAALVIANTFQVLVAQRTRTLALLRCVGADRRQLRRSVITEALLLGLAASVAGVLLGLLLVQGALLVLDGAGDVPLPATVSITLAAVLVPIVVGTLVTVVAAMAPARAATRVAPLAALRPADAPSTGDPAGRARAWISGLLILGGGGGLTGGVLVARTGSMELGLGLGLLGGAASFVGLVVGSVFWVPGLVGRAGTLLGRRGGVAARLAAANSVRNPRRTAATSGALFIGVTLVALMSSGAASTRATFDAGLDGLYPVDVAVGTVPDGRTVPALPVALAGQVAALEGVAAVAQLSGAMVEVSDGNGTGTLGAARAVEPRAAADVLSDPDQVEGLSGSTVVVASWVAQSLDIAEGDVVTVRATDGRGNGTGEGTELTALIRPLPGTDLLVTPQTLEQVSPGAPVSTLWVHLTDLSAAPDVLAAVSDLAADSGAALETTGGAVERAFFQQVVDTLLAIVVGLLAVAVVIAIVGVANTLSLSVIERRRENATLRAIGLTRRQLRATLAIEGLLVAGVGAVVGAVLGTLYGWAGASILLTGVGDLLLAVPWRDLGLVVVVALLAGALASVLPARSAASTPPVEALAAE